MANLFSLSGLLLGLTGTVLVFIILSLRKSRLHSVWILFNIAVAFWGWGTFWIGRAVNGPDTLILWKLSYIPILFISVFFFHVVYELCSLSTKKILIFAYIYAIAASIHNLFTDQYISGTRVIFGNLHYAYVDHITGKISFSIWVGLVCYGIYQLISSYLIEKGLRKFQILYFLLAVAVGFSSGLTNFIPYLGYDIFPFGNFGIVIYCLIATYAILRYRLMDINIVFRKSMVYSLSAGILTSLFVVIVITMTKFLSDMAGVESYTILAVASLIIAILFNPLRNRVQRFVDKKFYKKSYDYYSIIKQVSASLSSMFNRNNIFQFIGNILYDVMGLASVHMLVAVPVEGSYAVVYQISMAGGDKLYPVTEDGKSITIDESSSVIEVFSKSRDIVIKDEFPILEERFGQLVVEDFRTEMEKFKGAIMVPLFVDDTLSFIMVLGDKLSGDMFSTEDINLLSTITEQMSVALKNSQLYSGRVQTERLASIGMMSATFAHEIRNPLTSLKTFAQLMPEKYNDPEFRDTFTKIVVGEIEKIDTLIGDLLDFSSEKKLSRVDDFNIVELVDETLDYIIGKIGPQRENIDVVRCYHENVIDMSGDATKLKQAFGIIITNGYQAMNGRGKLTIDIKNNTKSVAVAITDTGEGIRHEDISKIFDPFVTTKEMGVGLGLAITKRIIDDHEGRIHVESRLSEGSTFTISLPVKN